MAKLIQVIETSRAAGRGIEDDPVRTVRQFWSPEGELLMEQDVYQATEIQRVIQRVFGDWPREADRIVAYDDAQRLLRLVGGKRSMSAVMADHGYRE